MCVENGYVQIKQKKPVFTTPNRTVYITMTSMRNGFLLLYLRKSVHWLGVKIPIVRVRTEMRIKQNDIKICLKRNATINYCIVSAFFSTIIFSFMCLRAIGFERHFQDIIQFYSAYSLATRSVHRCFTTWDIY